MPAWPSLIPKQHASAHSSDLGRSRENLSTVSIHATEFGCDGVCREIDLICTITCGSYWLHFSDLYAYFPKYFQISVLICLWHSVNRDMPLYWYVLQSFVTFMYLPRKCGQVVYYMKMFLLNFCILTNFLIIFLLPLCWWWFILLIQNDAKNLKKWLKPWHMGTHLRVLMNQHGSAWFSWLSKIIASYYALDESSTSIVLASEGLTLMLLMANLAKTKWCKKPEKWMKQAHWYSYESTQWELSNEYQHDMV